MVKRTYKIAGMDCAEEVAALKSELLPLVGHEDALAFDLINGRLIVESETPEAEIIGAVRRTGMRAVPWHIHVAGGQDGGAPWWRRRARGLLGAVSGVCVVAAWSLHAASAGPLEAFEGKGAPSFAIALYIAAVCSGGRYIFPKALHAARRLRPDMNLLMTVAVIGAMGLGAWFEAASVTFLFAMALLLESWSVARARRAISALMELAPAEATYRCPSHGGLHRVPVADVPIGAVVLVNPGEKIPLDGEVAAGESWVNEAPITGESSPVNKHPGSLVFAGSINHDGALEFKSTKHAGDTTLARIIRMVEEAQSRRAPSEQWVETFARYYTPIMMALAIAVAAIPPLFLGGWSVWFYNALVLLVIACPCALVISTPVSIVAGLATAARHGVLVKGGVFLEMPARIRAIAFDKTGTLTEGHPKVQEVAPLNGHTRQDLLERAAAIEARNNHPLARAIVREAMAEGMQPRDAEDVQAVRGKGAVGRFNGKMYWAGSRRFLAEHAGEMPELTAQLAEYEDAGHSVVAIGNDEHVCGIITVADAVRPEAAAAVRSLKAAGIAHVEMLTGDNDGTARAIAGAVGLDGYQSELLPEDKVAAVQRLEKQFGRVAMVGDGINDAPALAVSSLGIAMGAAGSDAAIETSDIALMSDDLTRLPWLIGHSKRTLAVIRQNIVFALGLKAVFLGLAVAGMATLWMAIAADMGASLIVIFNALRLLGDPIRG